MVIGVKANDYNATWEKAAFEIIPRNSLYEIREINSGLTFFIDKGAFNDEERSETRTNTTKGHGERHKGGRGRDRTPYDGSHEDDDYL